MNATPVAFALAGAQALIAVVGRPVSEAEDLQATYSRVWRRSVFWRRSETEHAH